MIELWFGITIVGAWVGAFLWFIITKLAGRKYAGDRRSHGPVFAVFIEFFVWLVAPLERLASSARVAPTTLTIAGLVVACTAGIAAAVGLIGVAGILYVTSGALDVLDGRVARRTGRDSHAGAFLDSCFDRLGELVVLGGFAWHLGGTRWLAAALLASAGSVMVSYSRARGEGLGIRVEGGIMQRGERIALIAAAALVYPLLNALWPAEGVALIVLGGALAVAGIGAVFTSVHRMSSGYHLLLRVDRELRAGQASGAVHSLHGHHVSQNPLPPP